MSYFLIATMFYFAGRFHEWYLLSMSSCSCRPIPEEACSRCSPLKKWARQRKLPAGSPAPKP